ncbi:hypothetical protein CRG98_031556 [Punica granatum]|uniref:Reverse transcriptase Ty1/copia-type domain-containing protein n=1 Tax=Punica granatum TaxID=22663 RepID=A0A2I0IVL3_PUNGR|nr:hypothetical protein CRG98_031556 [Punica granatum]
MAGYVFTLSGYTVSWTAVLQFTVALLTTKAKYMALAEAVKESIWLKGLSGDFGVDLEKLVEVASQGVVEIKKVGDSSQSSEHVDEVCDHEQVQALPGLVEHLQSLRWSPYRAGAELETCEILLKISEAKSNTIQGGNSLIEVPRIQP